MYHRDSLIKFILHRFCVILLGSLRVADKLVIVFFNIENVGNVRRSQRHWEAFGICDSSIYLKWLALGVRDCRLKCQLCVRKQVIAVFLGESRQFLFCGDTVCVLYLSNWFNGCVVFQHRVNLGCILRPLSFFGIWAPKLKHCLVDIQNYLIICLRPDIHCLVLAACSVNDPITHRSLIHSYISFIQWLGECLCYKQQQDRGTAGTEAHFFNIIYYS